MTIDFKLGFGCVPALLLLALSALRVLRECERGVVFQLGRFWKVKGPGLVLVIPGIQQMVRVDLRLVTMDVGPQDVISRDKVEIKHIDLNESMVRAIARQAEAERERRAKGIHAKGERQAAEALLAAAQTLARQPEAMQLRYLQTMTQVAGDRASSIVFPLPMDLLGRLLKGQGDRAEAA